MADVQIHRDGRGNYWVSWGCRHGLRVEADYDGCVWCAAESGDKHAAQYLKETEARARWNARRGY